MACKVIFVFFILSNRTKVFVWKCLNISHTAEECHASFIQFLNIHMYRRDHIRVNVKPIFNVINVRSGPTNRFERRQEFIICFT